MAVSRTDHDVRDIRARIARGEYEVDPVAVAAAIVERLLATRPTDGPASP